jgi:hypothetical protein
MNDVSDPAPDRFSFTYTEEELWAFGKLTQRRIDLGPAVDTYWAVVAGLMLAVGLVPLTALSIGLISPAAFRPVLATAYLAFTAGGIAFWTMMAMRTRGLARASYRKGRGSGTTDYVFSETGIVVSSNMLETIIPWRALKGVEDAGAFVLMWLHDHQAIGLPARLFTSAANRENSSLRSQHGFWRKGRIKPTWSAEPVVALLLDEQQPLPTPARRDLAGEGGANDDAAAARHL